jgi:hypothetical protein
VIFDIAIALDRGLEALPGLSLPSEFAATKKKAQLESHVISRELSPPIDAHERKIVNSKSAGVNNLNNLLQPFLRARISFQCTPRLKTERHHRKDDSIEKRTIRRVERTIDKDSGHRG